MGTSFRLLILWLCLVPAGAGLLGAVIPATGWFPPLGRTELSLQPLTQFLAQPGLWRSLYLSVFCALISTFIAYWGAMYLLACVHKAGRSSLIFKLISPLLAVPHITVAVGLLFLLQPSGWLARLLSPILTGWERPPNLNIVPDIHGCALILGLIAKELPFLLLMGLSALSQIRVQNNLEAATVMGYGPLSAWAHSVQPQLSKRMGLPVLIVLIFAVSVVDMAFVLAPSNPPPLAVRIVVWFRDPDLSFQFIAAVAAASQLWLALFCCGLWVGGGYILAQCWRMTSYRGWRWRGYAYLTPCLKTLFLVLALLPCVLSALGLCTTLIWAFADLWRFPAALPQIWGVKAWGYAGMALTMAGANSLLLGLASSALSIICAVFWLESRHHNRPHFLGRLEGLIYLPLLLPQAGFLFGLQILLIWLRFDGLFLTLLWVHGLFVFPYVMLSLNSAWHRFDHRFMDIAACLGASYAKRFFMIKLPMLMIPILTAFAVGFAVSSALYLPTIFASNGRATTLTTEAVTLALSASRQSLGIASMMQMLLPLAVFILCDRLAQARFAHFSYFRQ